MNSSNSADKKLVKNTIVYMIGNLSSKLLQILILPILTTLLVSEEYGLYDVIVNTVNLFIPIITLQITQGMFRDLFEADEYEKKKIISSVLGVLVLGGLLLGIIMFLINSFSGINFCILIYFLFISNIMIEFTQKIARCERKNTLMAISGVILTFSLLSLEVFNLLVLKMKIDGLLLANIVSGIIATLYLNNKLHIEKQFFLKCIDINTIKNLLVYSTPLAINSICWWLITTSDRYVLYYYMSASAIGIYAIAGKFSQSLTMITSIFQMAWQESVIIESSKDSRNEFYTRVFDRYVRLLLCGYILVLPIIKISIPFLLANEYKEGYLYIPLLLLGAVMSAFSQFYGSAYLAFKKTSGAVSTTLVAAIINILISVLLIDTIGLYAPALGTAVAFFVQWLIRIKQMENYFQVKLNKKLITFMISLMLLYCVGYYYESLVLDIIMIIFAIIILYTLNKEIIFKIINKVLRR